MSKCEQFILYILNTKKADHLTYRVLYGEAHVLTAAVRAEAYVDDVADTTHCVRPLVTAETSEQVSVRRATITNLHKVIITAARKRG